MVSVFQTILADTEKVCGCDSNVYGPPSINILGFYNICNIFLSYQQQIVPKHHSKVRSTFIQEFERSYFTNCYTSVRNHDQSSILYIKLTSSNFKERAFTVDGKFQFNTLRQMKTRQHSKLAMIQFIANVTLTALNGALSCFLKYLRERHAILYCCIPWCTFSRNQLANKRDIYTIAVLCFLIDVLERQTSLEILANRYILHCLIS